MMYHPHRMPFIDPLAVLFPSQNPDRMPFIEPPLVLILNQDKKAPLKTKILNQVQYYLSEDNLPNDVYLRKRMNDEGFVHIEFISGFNKLKALTSNVHLVLDSLRDSDIIEVQGNEIRNRHVWRKYVMPQDWRKPVYFNRNLLDINVSEKFVSRNEFFMQLKMAEATQQQTKKILQRSWKSPF
ncbi:unnamed protein product [Brassica rapa]|uniref:HTH La-type RNA-binding domain-containing protein n=1 Tax=Brassica campestris TaxID=3711 RepID=A0A8D9CN92_BRACM|nr:unnamed protein product [Brassica rapa]